MSPATPPGALPSAIDDAMHALFALGVDEQERAFAKLLTAHAEYAPTLLRRWLHVVTADADLPDRRAGLARYRIDGTLGTGGMGDVLLAHDRLLDRPVALKVARVHGGNDALRRCRNEARITARLEHPGIAPVHDVGTDADGGAWFVMRRIDGDAASGLFAAAHQDARQAARALEVLQRTAETVAFAHARGFVHRDLKPENVMSGSFGEVYVVDWGLAKAIGAAEEPAPDQTTASERTATRAGTVVGTPSYMAPERTRGEPGPADPRIDVYAIGALLYQVLTGSAPYAEAGDGASVLAALKAGPPRPVLAAAPRAPAALVAICERAMARDPTARYADVGALAADLAAFRAARAVKAYRTGPIVELALWLRRNRGLAGALAALALGLVVALVVTVLAFHDADRSRTRFRRLAGVVMLDEAKRRAADLYPPWPERLPAFVAWRTEFADPLRAGRGAVHDELVQLRAWAAAADRAADVDSDILLASLSHHEAALAAFFAADGLAARMAERETWARSIAERSIDRCRDGWDAAIAAVAADARFAGCRLTAMTGLVPLGADPASGLQEFCDLRSGTVPTRAADGTLQYADDAGVVFVLLPGGTANLGAQGTDARAPNHWPGAKPDEAPVQSVKLAPFLLAKHELTQAQWQRLAGDNPSLAIGSDTSRRPVGHVSWLAAERVLREDGMVLPTEAQWEYACRAGAGTAWASGDTVTSLRGFANVADESARDAFGPGFRFEAGFDDGFAADAPVGSFRANAFGLFDLHGNHWEWCLDAYAAPRRLSAPGQPGRLDGRTHRVYRGGSYAVVADNLARCAYRGKAPADTTLHDLGLRPARNLQ